MSIALNPSLPIKFQTSKIPRTCMNLLWVENLELKMAPFACGVGEMLEGGACISLLVLTSGYCLANFIDL